MADMARRIQAATRTAKVKLWSSKLTGGIWLICLGDPCCHQNSKGEIVEQQTYRRYMADMARRIQAATKTAKVKL
jgi:hypothetical protein